MLTNKHIKTTIFTTTSWKIKSRWKRHKERGRKDQD